MGKPFDPTEDARRQRAAEELARQRESFSAYRQGVEEVARDPVLYSDPDRIREIDLRFGSRPPYVRNPGYSLGQQLDRQVPGAAAAVLDRAQAFSSSGGISMNGIAREFRSDGPQAMPGVSINGQNYGVANLPDRRFDSKRDLVEQFVSHFDRDIRRQIQQNMPGTDAQWMRITGNHEGEHLNSNKIEKGVLDKMAEEVRADRSAYRLAHERGDGAIALAMRDLRALRADGDPIHASGALVDNNDQVNIMHLEAALNSGTVREKWVQDNFDWSTYTGKARNPEDLLKENPEAYFAAAQRGLDAMQAKAMADYNADPNNLANQRAVVQAQIVTDYQKGFEDAWRRRVLGQDVPERAPTQLITQEQEEAYYAEAALQDRIAVERFEVRSEADVAFDDDRVFAGVDWSTVPGEAETWWDLYGQDKVLYHEVEKQQLERLRDEALEAHRNNPSYETREALVQLEQRLTQNADMLQYQIQQRDGGGPSAAAAPVQILSDEERRAYYVERIAREAAPAPAAAAPAAPAAGPEATETESTLPIFGPDAEEPATAAPAAVEATAGGTDKGYQQGVDGSAYTTVVKGLTPGEPDVDLENGITVGGLPMGGVFGQSANPAPESIALVNAREVFEPDVVNLRRDPAATVSYGAAAPG